MNTYLNRYTVYGISVFDVLKFSWSSIFANIFRGKGSKIASHFFVFSQDHINSGKWNLLPGGKLNITLFEANFILRLEGQWGHPWMDMGFLPPG